LNSWLPALVSARYTWAGLLYRQVGAIIGGLTMLLVFMLLRLSLRRVWLAAGAFATVYVVLQTLQQETPFWLGGAIFSLLGIGLTWLFVRCGLIAAIVTLWITDMLLVMPLSTDLSSWVGAPTWIIAPFVVGLALFGFLTARKRDRTLAA
jgi:hypothetical protein